MFENADANSSPSQNDEYDNSAADYLHRAAQACAAGDAVLGMHLYLAAFEKGAHGAYAPDDEAVEGLRQAWALACKLKERSLAEYIFEKLEPYLASDEVAVCAEQLQRLALDKLEEFGLTREDLEDMTDMISQDFLGIDAPRLMKVEHRRPLPRSPRAALPDPEAAGAAGAGGRCGEGRRECRERREGRRRLAARGGRHEGRSGKGRVLRARCGARPGRQGGRGRHGPRCRRARGGVGHRAHLLRRHRRLQRHGGAHARLRPGNAGRPPVPEPRGACSTRATAWTACRPPTRYSSARPPARTRTASWRPRSASWTCRPSACAWRRTSRACPCCASWRRPTTQPQLNAVAQRASRGRGVLMLEDLDLWASPMTEGGRRLRRLRVLQPVARGARGHRAHPLGGGESRRVRAGLGGGGGGDRPVLLRPAGAAVHRGHRLSHA